MLCSGFDWLIGRLAILWGHAR